MHLIRKCQYNAFIMPLLKVTIVPREIGELWDQLLDQILHDVCLTVRPSLNYKDQIPHTLNDGIHVAKCYYQYTPNLCGYHATFNTLCFLNAISSHAHTAEMPHSHVYNIESASSFWSFKRRIQKCLFQYKRRNKLKNEWPWREQDILYGDFQRSYNKVCLEEFIDFDIFRKHNSFQLRMLTWEFQYSNLLLNEEKRRELNREIKQFTEYRGNKPLVLSIMLAITNHWMCMVAIKCGINTEYWFFDSKNRNALSIVDIEAFIQKVDLERIEQGRQPMNNFSKQNARAAIKDTQISVELIVKCLQGKQTIDRYVYNQQFNIFANDIHPKMYQTKQLQNSVKDYWQNIKGFFNNTVRMDLLTPQNNQRYKEMFNNVRCHQGSYCQKFASLLHKSQYNL